MPWKMPRAVGAMAAAGPTEAAGWCCLEDVFFAADIVSAQARSSDKRRWPADQRWQAALVRDLFGNIFHPVNLAPAWRTPTAISLARAASEKRNLPSGELDPDRLAVLADALEDAGCTNLDLLGHLRGPGPHVRGCWPVDLLLEFH